jgi:hypothetical protein
MPLLTKQEKADFAAHEDWRKWGDQFGWKLSGSNGEFAGEFYAHGGHKIYVPQPMRNDIERVIAANK